MLRIGPMSKIKISFVLPTSLQKDLKERVIQDGYDLKGKSKWVSEAISELLKLKGFPDLVKINDEMIGFEKLESIVIEKELKNKLDFAIIEVRKRYPVLEGVQSRIVRTAILQRLLS